MTKAKIFLYGAGGHGRVIADIIRGYRQYSFEGFIDDNPKIGAIRFDDFIKYHSGSFVALGVGDNYQRKKIFNKLQKLGVKIATLVDPSALIGSNVKIKKGVIIMPGVIINSKALIQRGAIINSGSIIEHDCAIGSFAHISPGVTLGGDVTIGAKTHIGLNSSIIPQVCIGSNSIIGAGSVVVKDIPKNVTAFGVPAKVIK